MTGAMTEEFVQVACDLLQRGDTDALVSLEWEPRPDGPLSAWLDATLSLARAQGRTLAVTSALGIACAHILYPALAPGDLSVSAALDVRDVGGRLELIGPAGIDLAEQVLVDAPGLGLGLVEARWISPAEGGGGPFDPLVAARRLCPISAIEVVAPFGDHDEQRVAALNVARLFMSTEILGSCEHMMATAVTYAHDRVQFGQQIGTFQAVQHMLAGAEVHVRGLRSSIEMLVPRLGELRGLAALRHIAFLKALAGRTGHHVSQATLQVLGAIGFTEEHEHHRYEKRTLTLDALCGSNEQLALEIGRAAMRGETHLVAVP